VKRPLSRRARRFLLSNFDFLLSYEPIVSGVNHIFSSSSLRLGENVTECYPVGRPKNILIRNLAVNKDALLPFQRIKAGLCERYLLAVIVTPEVALGGMIASLTISEVPFS